MFTPFLQFIPVNGVFFWTWRCVRDIRHGKILLWKRQSVETYMSGTITNCALGFVEGGVGAGNCGESQQHHGGENAGGAKTHRERLCERETEV
jgi:hypothetical protein